MLVILCAIIDSVKLELRVLRLRYRRWFKPQGTSFNIPVCFTLRYARISLSDSEQLRD